MEIQLKSHHPRGHFTLDLEICNLHGNLKSLIDWNMPILISLFDFVAICRLHVTTIASSHGELRHTHGCDNWWMWGLSTDDNVKVTRSMIPINKDYCQTSRLYCRPPCWDAQLTHLGPHSYTTSMGCTGLHISWTLWNVTYEMQQHAIKSQNLKQGLHLLRISYDKLIVILWTTLEEIVLVTNKFQSYQQASLIFSTASVAELKDTYLVPRLKTQGNFDPFFFLAQTHFWWSVHKPTQLHPFAREGIETSLDTIGCGKCIYYV